MASSLRAPPSRLVVMMSTAEWVLMACSWRVGRRVRRRGATGRPSVSAVALLALVDRGATLPRVLEEHLTTAPARREGFAVAGDHRQGHEATAALAHEVAHEGALGAQGESVTGVLDVGAHDDDVRRWSVPRRRRGRANRARRTRVVASRRRRATRAQGISLRALTGPNSTLRPREPFDDPRRSSSDEVRDALERRSRCRRARDDHRRARPAPTPVNLEVAASARSAVRERGAVPATIGVVRRAVVVGLDHARCVAARRPATRRAQALDAGPRARRSPRASTGRPRWRPRSPSLSRGGIGDGDGRPRRRPPRRAATFDESADLVALSRTPVLVVASGVKSILDVPATLERLDTLGVPVAGYRR